MSLTKLPTTGLSVTNAVDQDVYSRLIKGGRITHQLGEQRRLRESKVYRPHLRVGASRGFLAGRVSNYKKWIAGALRFSGMWQRGKNNARDIKIRYNTVKISSLPPHFADFTLLHLSDLHLDIASDMTDVIASKIKDLDYDVCVITGDFRAETSGDWRPCMRFFSRLRRQMAKRIFAVLGNHDCLAIAEALEDLDVVVLLNENHTITRGGDSIAIVGIDDPHYFETDDLATALSGVHDAQSKILLSHTPEPYQQAEALQIDLMLAGHTHGGQICLPGGYPIIVNAQCPRKFCRGPWRFNRLQGYTSTGTGSSVLDVRFNCAPEIVVHRLIQ